MGHQRYNLFNCLLVVFTNLLLIYSCVGISQNDDVNSAQRDLNTNPYIMVLGTIQDAGSPQIGCQKECCKDLWSHPDPTRKVVSLGIYDPADAKKILIDATPDMPAQLEFFNSTTYSDNMLPDAIYLTHAHIGHYTGLMYLGKEALNSTGLSVYAMPRMRSFLTDNGPWSQLVSTNNIQLKELRSDSSISATLNTSITPVVVPHRDEYSETVGYYITGPEKTVLYIPDIDKWHLWERDITKVIKKVDIALLDGPFYDGQELNNRDMSTIPHPTLRESMALFDKLSAADKSKVHFIHFNHTNPVLNHNSAQHQEVLAKGYNFATFGQLIFL